MVYSIYNVKRKWCNINKKLPLDYSIQSPQERNELVKQIVDETPPEQLTPRYLELLADYLVFAMDKEEKKKKKILTANRMVTLNRRETSFQGLAEKLENGEDGIYHLESSLGKSARLTNPDSITQNDIDSIEGLKELRAAIDDVAAAEKNACGKDKYLLHKQLIQMRQDQYVIKNEHRKNGTSGSQTQGNTNDHHKDFYMDAEVREDGTFITPHGFTLTDTRHVSAALCNYSALKIQAAADFNSDAWFIINDLEALVEEALKEKYPMYYDIVIYKINQMRNSEIQKRILQDYKVEHTTEHISALWRRKIPKIIANYAKDEYLNWHYLAIEKGKYKKCTRCGQIKLMNKYNFSRNKSSKDGYYSICKECRNSKNKKKVGE